MIASYERPVTDLGYLDLFSDAGAEALGQLVTNSHRAYPGTGASISKEIHALRAADTDMVNVRYRRHQKVRDLVSR